MHEQEGSTLPNERQEPLRVYRTQSECSIKRNNGKLRFCAVNECPSATGVHKAGIRIQPYSSISKLDSLRVLACDDREAPRSSGKGNPIIRVSGHSPTSSLAGPFRDQVYVVRPSDIVVAGNAIGQGGPCIREIWINFGRSQE